MPFPYYEHRSGSGNLVNAGNASGLAYRHAGYVSTPDIGAHEWSLPRRAQVWIEVVDAYAAEGSPVNTTSLVVRRSTVDSALNVDYTVSGSASVNDYEPLSGSVSFAIGQAETFITITPKNSSALEHAKRLTIELARNQSAYELVAPLSSASITIQDNESLAVDAGFEEAEGYCLGNVHGQRGWVAAGTPTGFEVVSNPNGPGQVLKVVALQRYRTGTWTPTSAEPGGTYSSSSSKIAFAFDYFADGEWRYRVHYLDVGHAEALRMDLTERKDYDGGTMYNLHDGVGRGPNFRAGWIRFQGVLDYSTKKYTLFVNGHQQMGGTSEGWMSFRNGGANFAAGPTFRIYQDEIQASAYLDKLAMQMAGSPDALATAPVAHDDSASGNKNKSVTVDVIANDSGSNLKIIHVTKPTNGVAWIIHDNKIEYAPNAEWTGTDKLYYTERDGTQLHLRDTAKLQIQVTTTSQSKLTVTMIARMPINEGTLANVFDGNFGTYGEHWSGGGWFGLDLGTPGNIAAIKVAGRVGFESRMIGGRFEASNSADFSSGVVQLGLAIATAPASNRLTTFDVTANGYRYVRYIHPTGVSSLAELEFWGESA